MSRSWPARSTQPTGLKGECHIFVEDKGDYYAIDDGLPQFERSRRPTIKVAGDRPTAICNAMAIRRVKPVPTFPDDGLLIAFRKREGPAWIG